MPEHEGEGQGRLLRLEAGDDDGRSLRFEGGKRYLPFAYRSFRGGGYPDSVKSGGLKAVFRTDFRAWLDYGQVIRSKFLTDEERVVQVIGLCFERIPAGFPPAHLLEGAAWFFGADHISRKPLLDDPELAAFKDAYEDRREREADNEENWGREFDLFWDAQSIRAAFLAHFEVDLFTAEMHWWDFLGLLNELPENCKFNRERHIRSMKVDDAPKEAKTDLRINKMLLRVPDKGVV